MSIDSDKIRMISKQSGISGVNLYCIDEKNSIHLRTFAPILGIAEDPVCGSGNAAVAYHMRITDKAKLVGEKYTAFQGSVMGRNGIIQVSYDGDDIYIGGKSVVVVDGQIII